MIKAGLIGALTGFIYVMSLTMLSPLCTLCLTPFLGLSIGYLSGQIDKPVTSETSLSRGGVAGGITGIGAVAGQMLATVVNGILITHSKQLPMIAQEFGISPLLFTNSQEYWQATVTASVFCGLLNLTVISGLGALGSLVWFQRRRRLLLAAVSP